MLIFVLSYCAMVLCHASLSRLLLAECLLCMCVYGRRMCRLTRQATVGDKPDPDPKPISIAVRLQADRSTLFLRFFCLFFYPISPFSLLYTRITFIECSTHISSRKSNHDAHSRTSCKGLRNVLRRRERRSALYAVQIACSTSSNLPACPCCVPICTRSRQQLNAALQSLE